MASIQERAGNYRVLWRYGGTRKGAQQSCTFGTLTLAQQAKEMAEAHRHKIGAAGVESAILGNVDQVEPESSLPTLAEWSRTWLKSRTRITPGVKATYEGQLRREILPALGHKHLDHITGVDIADLLTALQAKFKAKTVTRYYSCLHACLRYAVTEGFLTSNPARRTDFVRDQIAHDDASDDGDGHVYLSRWEYAHLLACVPADWRPLVEFLAGTGARFSEATHVAVNAFDPMAKPRAAVRIHAAWKHDGKGGWYTGSTKGRNRRTVLVGQAVVDAVLPLAAGESGNTLLFRMADGGRVDYQKFLRGVWNPAIVAAMRCPQHPPDSGARQVTAAELAGPRCRDNGGHRYSRVAGRAGTPCGSRVVPGWNRCRPHQTPAPDAVSTCDCPTRLRERPTPHDLRHSHVAWLIAAGRPIASISRRIGHHSTVITERVYAGILPEVSEADVDALDATLPPAERRAGAEVL